MASHAPSPRKKYSFYIDAWQAEELKRIKQLDGVLESEQIRRALALWFAKQERKRQMLDVTERAEGYLKE